MTLSFENFEFKLPADKGTRAIIALRRSALLNFISDAQPRITNGRLLFIVETTHRSSEEIHQKQPSFSITQEQHMALLLDIINTFITQECYFVTTQCWGEGTSLCHCFMLLVGL